MSSAIVNGSAIGISNPHAAGVLKVIFAKEFLVDAKPLNSSGVLVPGLSLSLLLGLVDWPIVLLLEGLRSPPIGGNILFELDSGSEW